MREGLRVVPRRFTEETLVYWRGSYLDQAASPDRERRGEQVCPGLRKIRAADSVRRDRHSYLEAAVTGAHRQ